MHRKPLPMVSAVPAWMWRMENMRRKEKWRGRQGGTREVVAHPASLAIVRCLGTKPYGRNNQPTKLRRAFTSIFEIKSGKRFS